MVKFHQNNTLFENIPHPQPKDSIDKTPAQENKNN